MNTDTDLTKAKALLHFLTLKSNDPGICAQAFRALGQSAERLLFNQGASGTEEQFRAEYHHMHKKRERNANLREAQFQQWFSTAFHSVGSTTFVYEDDAMEAMKGVAEMLAASLIERMSGQGAGMADPFKRVLFQRASISVGKLKAFVSKAELEELKESVEQFVKTESREHRLI